MVYEAYERRIQRVARVLNFIRRHIVLFSALAIAAVTLTTGFFSVRGIILEDVACAAESYLYGDTVELIEARALFSKVRYEYAPENSEDWSEDAPLLPGRYRVRAVSSRFIGSKGYGEPVSFTITKRPLTVYSDQASTMYGTNPRAEAEGLLKRDTLQEISFRFDNLENPDAVTATPKVSSIRIVNRDDVDVTEGYDISVETKPIRLTPAPITVKVDDVSKFYDTTPLSSTAWSLTAGRVAAGDTVEVSFDESLSITEPGSLTVYPEQIRVMKGELDVTGYYEITEEGGTLTVSYCPVTFLTATDSKVYDATPLTNAGVEIAEGSLLEGHSLRVVESSILSIVTVAESGENRLAAVITDADGNDVTHWYTVSYRYGTLTILPRTVTVVAKGDTKTYDAQPFATASLLSMESVEGLLDGHTVPNYQYEIDGQSGFSPVDAGSYTKRLRPTDIQDASGASVYANYTLTRVPATLTIEKRVVKLSTEDWSTVYNGTAQTWQGTPTVVEGSFLTGHAPSYLFEAVGPNVGTYANRFSVTQVSDGVDNTLQKNYSIECLSASVTITKRRVSFEAYGTPYSTVYNGSVVTHADLVRALTGANADEGLVAGAVVYPSFTSVGPNVGTYDNVYTVAQITYRGENVTDNYEIVECRTMQLEIRKRPIVVQSASLSKQYDRTALSNPAFVEAASDLVAGHALRWIGDYPTQTAVGSRSNSFTVENVGIWNGTELVTDNYEITSCSFGRLEVTKRILVLTSTDHSKVYDAKPFDIQASWITVGGSGLLSGDTVSYDFTDALQVINVWNTATGNFTFVPTVTMRDGEDPDDCYDIQRSFGTLTVTKKDVTFTSMGGSKTYDQSGIYVNQIASVDGLVGNHTYKAPTNFKTHGPDVRIVNGEVTYYQNTFNITWIYDPSDSDVNLYKNYNVIRVYGELWINPIRIVLQTANESVVYNGLRQHGSADAVTTVGSYLTNHIPTYSFWEEGPDVGAYDSRIYAVTVRDSADGNRDVSHNYEFDYDQQTGKLTITPKKLVITTHGGGAVSKVYDGTEFIGSYSQSGLIADAANGVYHTVTSYQWTPIGPDVVTNAKLVVVISEIQDGTGRPITQNYEIEYVYGTFSITTRRVVIGTPDLIHVYDKTAAPGATYAGFTDETKGIKNSGLVLKHAPKLRYTGSQLNIGSSPNSFEILDIVDENGKSVAGNYEIVRGSTGTITVKPRELIIETKSAKLVYNGKAQQHKFFAYVNGSDTLLAGDELILTYLASVTNVSDGQKPNTVTWKTVFAGTDTECTDAITGGTGQSYYTVTLKFVGTIEILPVEITLTSDSDSKTYDGYALQNPTVTESARPVEGQRFEHDFASASPIRGGEYQNEFVTRIVWSDTGEPVDSSNYKLTYVFGTRVIHKRSITVTTEDAEKFYDRTPLTCHRYTITAGKLADTDFETAYFTGKQTEVGNSPNTMTLKVTHTELGDVTDDCYDITYVEGTLTVKPGKLYVASESAWKVYDGKPLTCTKYDVDGLLPGDTLEVTFYGSQTEVGSSKNFFTVTLNGSEELLYYELVPMYGELEVIEEGDPNPDVKDPEIPERDPQNPEMSDQTEGQDDQNGNLGSITDENGNESGDIGDSIDGLGSSDGGPGDLDTSGTNGGNNMIENGENSDGVAMRLTTDHKDTVYMRFMNYGNYDPTTDTWLQANPYTGEITVNPLYFTAMRFAEMGLQEHYMKVALTGTQFMIPYYSMYKGDMTKENDVVMSYAEQEYELSYFSFNFEQNWRRYYSQLTAESDDAALAAWEDAYAQFVRENYLAVPTSTAKALREIAERNGWEQGNIELINLIAEYIRNVAVYEQRSTTPCAECGDEVVCFLTHDRRGVCWEYAGAATLLYRYMGIPARLVSGYMADTVNGTVEVTAKSAHAWVEIYIDNLGWVQMEVTGSLSQLPQQPTDPDTPDNPDDPDEMLGKVTFYIFNTTKEYNGTEQFCSGAWLQGLPEGYTYEVITNETGMGCIDVNNGIQISLRNGRIKLIIYAPNGEIVTNRFEIEEPSGYGILKIEPRVIKVRTSDVTSKQTGKPVTADHAWIIQGSLLSGHTLAIYDNAWTHEAIRPGTYENTFDIEDGWSVVDSDGVDKTRNYRLELEPGTITVLS